MAHRRKQRISRKLGLWLKRRRRQNHEGVRAEIQINAEVDIVFPCIH